VSTSFTLSAPPPAEPCPTGISGLQDRLIECLHQQESTIVGDIENALELSGPLMSLPKPLQEQFHRWAEQPQYQTPEMKRILETAKNKIIQIHNDNREYTSNKVAYNADKIRLELSIKAIGKVISGVQQLLSSQ